MSIAKGADLRAPLTMEDTAPPVVCKSGYTERERERNCCAGIGKQGHKARYVFLFIMWLKYPESASLRLLEGGGGDSFDSRERCPPSNPLMGKFWTNENCWWKP